MHEARSHFNVTHTMTHCHVWCTLLFVCARTTCYETCSLRVFSALLAWFDLLGDEKQHVRGFQSVCFRSHSSMNRSLFDTTVTTINRTKQTQLQNSSDLLETKSTVLFTFLSQSENEKQRVEKHQQRTCAVVPTVQQMEDQTSNSAS